MYFLCIPTELSRFRLLYTVICLSFASHWQQFPLTTTSTHCHRAFSLASCFVFFVFCPSHHFTPTSDPPPPSPVLPSLLLAFHLDLWSCFCHSTDPGCMLLCQTLSSLVSLIAFNEPACLGLSYVRCVTQWEGEAEGGGKKKGK